MSVDTSEREHPKDDCTTREIHSADDLLVEVYGPDSRPNGFDVLAGEWNSLLERSLYNTIFLTLEWQSTWWTYLGNGDLWIVTLRDPATRTLVAIAPLYTVTPTEGEMAGKTHLHLVGCIEVSDYLDLIIARGWEAAVNARLAAWLTGPDAPHWDVIDLCNLPEESHTWQILPPLLERPGLNVRTFQEDTAPQFLLPPRYEDYLNEVVEKKQRHEIKRKQRRAEREADVGFHLVGSADSLEAEVDDFIALQRASRDDKSEFMTPEMRRFFSAMARTLFDAGWLRLLFLTIDGEKAAALFAFEYDRRFLLYNSGYDPQAHAQLSPGWVNLAYAIQYAIALGCTHFDFMQGDEEYKYRFGARDYRVMRIRAERSA